MAKKIKILYLITKDDVGGAQKYVQDLTENLDQNVFETKIITGGKKGIRFLSNAFLPYLLFINDWLALAEIFFMLRREKPDVLHLNSSKAGVIGSLAAWLYNLTNTKNQRLKVIFTAHGWVFNPDNDLSSFRRNLYILFHQLAARFQDIIINVSDYDRKLALKYKIASADKLITVHNGIDYKKLEFLDKTTARKALLTLLNPKPSTLNPDDIWVGSIGRLVTEKNYLSLVAAAAAMRNPKVKFFIIGSGPQKPLLTEQIKKGKLEDRFFIIENVSPAAPFLKAFDIFALSSVKEGLPYTLLEAMAAEVPVVTTRIGGMTEIIDPPEGVKKGLVMPPQEPEELARAINYLIANPEEAKKFIREAKKFLKEKLTMERMITETAKIYYRINASTSF